MVCALFHSGAGLTSAVAENFQRHMWMNPLPSCLWFEDAISAVEVLGKKAFLMKSPHGRRSLKKTPANFLMEALVFAV